MSRKGGERKTVQLGLRIDARVHQKLQEIAGIYGITECEYVRFVLGDEINKFERCQVEMYK